MVGEQGRASARGIVASVGVLALVTLGFLAITAHGPEATAADAPASSAPPPAAVAVQAGRDCGQGWAGGRAGTTTFRVTNPATVGAEVYLAGPDGRIYLDLEQLGAGAAADGTVRLTGGTYHFVCLEADEEPVDGPGQTVTGQVPDPTAGISPVTDDDLIGPTQAYQQWVSARLPLLTQQVTTLADDVHAGRLDAARVDWLTAHTTFDTLGAAYDAFGDVGERVDGLPAAGTTALSDPDLHGFRKLEALLWSGAPADQAGPVVDALVQDTGALGTAFADPRIDLATLGLRAHEILENALQTELRGQGDGGSGTTLAAVRAEVDGARAALDPLHAVLTRSDVDVDRIDAALAALAAGLDAEHAGGTWVPWTALPLARHEQLDAQADEAVELLAQVAAVTDPAEVRMSIDRRTFLRGVAGTIGTIGVATAVGPAAAAAATNSSTAAAGAVVPFHGAHQAGVLTPAQRCASFVALDVVGARTDLVDALRTLTRHARDLTAGTLPAPAGPGMPPADSGVLGTEPAADALTVTLGLGASLFDDRFGLADRRPARLVTMPAFPDDALRREVCDGDLLLQVCAQQPDAVAHAVRDLLRATRGTLQVRWRQDGFVAPPRPTGAPRNLMGFKDGSANPDPTDATTMDQVVWTHAGGDEPAWVEGGTYVAVRLIRMLVEFWDRVSINEQERMIGRRRDSGAPLTGTHETDDPHLERDPSGDVIPLDAHMRLANSRTPGSDALRMLRRPYNYDAGTDANGNLDMGLVFVAFNSDLDRQFAAVQQRLAGEPLVDYISPFGGGYWFVPPGVRSATDWYASGLLT